MDIFGQRKKKDTIGVDVYICGFVFSLTTCNL